MPLGNPQAIFNEAAEASAALRAARAVRLCAQAALSINIASGNPYII